MGKRHGPEGQHQTDAGVGGGPGPGGQPSLPARPAPGCPWPPGNATSRWATTWPRRWCTAGSAAPWASSTATPLTESTSEFFLSLDIPIGEIYGLSESSGPHSISTHSDYRILRWAGPGGGRGGDGGGGRGQGQRQGQGQGAGAGAGRPPGLSRKAPVSGLQRPSFLRRGPLLGQVKQGPPPCRWRVLPPSSRPVTLKPLHLAIFHL